MLHLPDIPHRMEAYDISNLAGTDIVASMVVFQDGKPLKSAYKRFRVEGLTDQDDYASMHQVLLRRLTHYVQQDAGFSEHPDVLLIDGGVEHTKVAEDVLQTLGLDIPAYGMVKDDKHRTRALVTAAGDEIAISAVPSVFALIGTIQEETHRFAITYQRALRSRRMKKSGLEDIPGIGEKRRQALLKKFRSVKAISQAERSQLEQVLPRVRRAGCLSAFSPEGRRANAMRVITGTARGVPLKAPRGMDTRPTMDQVKEGIFSAIQFEVEGRTALDLFAGSGQLGIEALSRGAAHCTFVDKGREPVSVIRGEPEKDKAGRTCRSCAGGLQFLPENLPQAVRFDPLDPPYAEIFLETALKIISEIDILTNSGIIVCERPFEKSLPDDIPGLARYRDYRYGKAAVTIFRRG